MTQTRSSRNLENVSRKEATSPFWVPVTKNARIEMNQVKLKNQGKVMNTFTVYLVAYGLLIN